MSFRWTTSLLLGPLLQQLLSQSAPHSVINPTLLSCATCLVFLLAHGFYSFAYVIAHFHAVFNQSFDLILALPLAAVAYDLLLASSGGYCPLAKSDAIFTILLRVMTPFERNYAILNILMWLAVVFRPFNPCGHRDI